MTNKKTDLFDKKIDSTDIKSKEINNKKRHLTSHSTHELIQELKSLLSHQNPYSVSKKADEIKTEFYKSLKKEREIYLNQNVNENDLNIQENKLHPLEIEFKKVNDKFRKIKFEYREKRDSDEQKNLLIKQNIIRDIDKLREEEESIKKTTFEKLKTLQNKWKKTGNVPLSENNNLWQNYHHHVELFYDYIKINNELRDLDFKRNLEKKILLCEESEKIISEKSINTAFEILQELHLKWKNIGPVERNKRNEIWERFQIATKKINKRKNDYFNKKIRISNNNLNKRAKICIEIQELLNSKPKSHQEWSEVTKKHEEFSKIWKKILPIEKKDLKLSWKEFRDTNNNFFNEKKENKKKRKEISMKNLELKMIICKKAEEISSSNDWKNTGKKLIKLQEDWKKSPFVPNNLSNDIWKRFRYASNIFFTNREKHYKKIDQEKLVNLKMKEEFIYEVKKFKISENYKDDIKKLQEFSRKWNSIGENINEKSSINENFKKIINNFYNNLKVGKSEKENIKFIAITENIKGNTVKINKEKTYLKKEIETIRKTIIQYENNILFFGYGKGTEGLKEEVMKKIEKSKSQIKSLENKQALLNKI